MKPSERDGLGTIFKVGTEGRNIQVQHSAKHLLVGSVEAHSGKSAMVLAIAHQLQTLGHSISYGKPLGSCLDNPLGPACHTPPEPSALASAKETEGMDEDVHFLAKSLNLDSKRLCPTVLMLDPKTIEQQLAGHTSDRYDAQLAAYNSADPGDLVVVEGPSTLDEGYLFGLSLRQMAERLDSPILLVSRFREPWSIDSILGAKQRLGDRVLGVVFNDVPTDSLDLVKAKVQPYLEERGIQVFGIVPHSELLRSVSVEELVYRLGATVISSPERQNLMVESLCIGAMNVNSALKYFRKGHNMAVVTGGDRADLQLAALETSTQCLILTGRVGPREDIVARAVEMEIPILSVDLDTLSTVEIIEKAFGEVRFHEQVKAQCVSQMSQDYLDIQRLVSALDL